MDYVTIATNMAYNIAMRANDRAVIALEMAITALHNNDHIAAYNAARDAIAATNTARLAAHVATNAAFINTSKSIRDTFFHIAIDSANIATRPFIISAASIANEACIVRDDTIANVRYYDSFVHC